MRSASLNIGQPTLTDFEQSPKFQQSALKLYWARVHAYHASALWEDAIQKHFQAATGQKNNLPYPLHEHLFAPPIPFAMPLFIGDCLRNLRSSLDYLVSEMARARNLPDNQTVFPFTTDASSLKGSFNEAIPCTKHRNGRKAGALYDLGREYPNLKDVILNKIKPYSAANGADPMGDVLWRVITSDNIDKHRLMPLALQQVSAGKIITDFGATFEGGSIIGEIFRFPPGTKMDKKSDFALDILFEEPDRLRGRPVMSTLVEGCNAVTQVIEIFRDEFDLTSAQ